MDPLTMVAVGAGLTVGIAGLVAWLRQRRRKARSGQANGGGYGGPDSDYGWGRTDYEADAYWQRQEEERRQREERERQARSERRVREVLNGNTDVAKELLKFAGQAHLPVSLASQDNEAIRQIARTTPELTLQIMSAASRSHDQFEAIELDALVMDVPVDYPTHDMRVERMDAPDEMHRLIPAELGLDDDQFYAGLAQEDLHVVQPYDKVVRRKRLYILLDVSGSMGQGMRNEFPRIAWAGGVALQLLLRATKGEAEYLLRYFDGEPHRLQEIRSPEEAAQFISELLRLQASGGGTDIQAALRRAIADIRSSELEVETSDILLISDGETTGHGHPAACRCHRAPFANPEKGSQDISRILLAPAVGLQAHA